DAAVGCRDIEHPAPRRGCLDKAAGAAHEQGCAKADQQLPPIHLACFNPGSFRGCSFELLLNRRLRCETERNRPGGCRYRKLPSRRRTREFFLIATTIGLAARRQRLSVSVAPIDLFRGFL